jgi:hypothetical protein
MLTARCSYEPLRLQITARTMLAHPTSPGTRLRRGYGGQARGIGGDSPALGLRVFCKAGARRILRTQNR